jgi:uncharacterized protein
MPIELLVLQPTPFCNIDCDYCYLPARGDRSRMSLETLRTALTRVFDSGLVEDRLSIVWHAGEPLVVPPDDYRAAFAVVADLCPPGLAVRHCFQTNGTLIDERWCRLILEYDIQVGVSLDGPAWLHDRHRKTRAGRGTHAATMRGLERLHDHGVPVHVICLLTSASLAHADAIVDFFVDAGVRRLGFNVEEIEGANTGSSLAVPGIEIAFRRFFERILERLATAPANFRLREVDGVLEALRDPRFGELAGNSQNMPLAIVSIAWDGAIGTFSPELLGFTDPRYGRLAFGNVRRDALANLALNANYRRVAADIEAGVAACRRECAYFAFCRGGAPANKLAETGTFAATETLFCRLTQKVIVECVLAALERDLLLSMAIGSRPQTPERSHIGT